MNLIVMLNFIHNIYYKKFVEFSGRQQAIIIPICTNSAPLLGNFVFLYSFEVEFIKEIVKGNYSIFASSFNTCCRHITDVLWVNNLNYNVH